jgi:DNA-binding NtrC family response regulator
LAKSFVAICQGKGNPDENRRGHDRSFSELFLAGPTSELLGCGRQVILAPGGNMEERDILRKSADVEGDSQVDYQSFPMGDMKLSDIEKRVILETLDKFNGNRTKTAEALGIGRRTLIRKLHEYGVARSSEDEDE